MSAAATRDAVEAVARNSYGRLVAYLAARSRDVAAAEDALGDAFAKAMERWPEDGVPDKPEAWLLRVARNRLIDGARRSGVRERLEPELARVEDEARALAGRAEPFPDERLKLLFVCAHPAIDVAARAPLMLQAVLGMKAERIASAFLVSPSAMSQRLARAKNKIRDAEIAFRVPEKSEWDERISFVLDAIYSAYTAGWETLSDTSSTLRALANEAVELGRTLVALVPEDPEARGLLALMLHCEVRRAARFASDGSFIPLDGQDSALWSRERIDEAEGLLRAAAKAGRMGRYQLEAAIQSIHAHRAVSGAIDWGAIALLYEGLICIAPSVGALVGRAVAMAEAGDPTAGAAALGEIPEQRTASYQPYWAARGHLLGKVGEAGAAREAFERAASLTDDPALRDYLFRRAAAMK